MTQSEAQSACRQRNSSSLPRITNSNIQFKLKDFRTADTRKLLSGSGFWIDVKAVGASDFHWIDGASLAGLVY